MLNFLKKHWLCVLILIIIALISIFDKNDNEELLKENKQIKQDIDRYEKIIDKQLEQIEKMSKKDTVYVDSIRYIKVKADAKIKYVDTMSISSMQEFFSDRYSRE